MSLLAAWDMTWFVCPCKQCCCYAVHQKGGEMKRKQNRLSSINIWLCLRGFLPVKSEPTQKLGNEDWALVEEGESSQMVEKIVCGWTVGWLGNCQPGVGMCCLYKRKLNNITFFWKKKVYFVVFWMNWGPKPLSQNEPLCTWLVESSLDFNMLISVSWNICIC